MNDEGQLGHGDDYENTPIDSYFPSGYDISRNFKATDICGVNIIDKKIIQVSAGNDRSFLLDNNGKVYSFGMNDKGQLGHGDDYDKNEYTNSSFPSGYDISRNYKATDICGQYINGKIKSISSGTNHTLLLDEYGMVYSFGYHNKELNNNDDEIYICTI